MTAESENEKTVTQPKAAKPQKTAAEREAERAARAEQKKREKKLKQYRRYLRAAIQLLFFLFIPSIYTAAFNGIKYIFTQIGANEVIGMTSFITILIVVCVYTVIFGRFFCGYACAFGSFGDFVRWAYVLICKKLKKKPITLSKKAASVMTYLKYVVLAAIVLMCFGGVYSNLSGTSPWDVFSMLHAGNFRLGGYIPGLVILILLMVGMAVQERFFCRFFCPMGAIFSLLPVLPFFSLHRDRENCIKGCSACTKNCPSDIGLPNDGSLDVCGDCFQCQKCIDVCPKSNIHCGIKSIRGNEFVFTILRAILLAAVMMLAGA